MFYINVNVCPLQSAKKVRFGFQLKQHFLMKYTQHKRGFLHSLVSFPNSSDMEQIFYQTFSFWLISLPELYLFWPKENHLGCLIFWNKTNFETVNTLVIFFSFLLHGFIISRIIMLLFFFFVFYLRRKMKCS